MQNFTLGNKGTFWFSFAFVLLFGILPTFGQNCPTVNDTDQDFCGLATVADLQATANGDDIAWYDTATSTSPLRSEDVLEDGEDYFAGNISGSCNNRQAVLVSITDVGPPTLGTGEDEFFTPCERAVDNPQPKTIGDLREGIQLNPVDGYSIEYYTDQFDKDEQALPDSFVLVSGTSYFAGYVSNDNTCESSRLALRYDPNVVNAPTGPAQQTVCQGTTVGELQASGTNRWYSTATQLRPISNNTVVEDGETYYATLVVPSDGPPCESTDRLAVTVTVQNAILTEETQEFCESIGTGNEAKIPTVADLSPTGATWYATVDALQPLPSDTELVNGEDYFNRETGDDCTQTRVTVEINDSPNAGGTTFLTVCENDAPFDLLDFYEPSILGAPDAGGTITPALASGTTIFDPAVDEARRYTYTVQSTNEDCPDDFSFITIDFNEAPNAGDDQNLEICTADIQALINNPGQAEELFLGMLSDNIDRDGTFSPSLQVIIFQYFQDSQNNNFPATYSTTYTVNNGNCEDSAELSVTVYQSPDAGEDASITLSTSDDPINLFDVLGGTPDENGTFSPGNEDGSFDPADYEEGDYEFTYTVSNNNCTDTATVTVTITEDMMTCPEVQNTEQEFCQSISDDDGNNARRPTVNDLAPANATWYASADATEALPNNTVLEDGETYFAGNAGGTCPDRTSVTVTINDSPNAGRTTFITVCNEDEPFDLLDVFNPSVLGPPEAGGTITPALASGTTIFDPAVDAGRQYRYTVQSTNEDCPDDFAFITITITDGEPANAGDDMELSFCTTDGIQNLYDSLSQDANSQGTFTIDGQEVEDGMFNPADYNAGTTNATYTVDEDTPCATGNDSATFTITIFQGPDAGEDASITLSTTDDPINLFTVLGGTPDEGGTFSPGNEEGSFDPADYEEGDYEFTYTVSNNNCTDTATVTVTITEDMMTCPEVQDTEQSFCESISDEDGNDARRPTVNDLAPANATWYASADATEALPNNTVLEDGETYFAGNQDGDCPDRTAVTVTIDDSPNAGATTEISVCRNDAPFDLLDVFNPSVLGPPEAGGTVTPALASGTTIFDPSVDQARRYQYTVQSENQACPDDFAYITINITDGAFAGEDMDVSFCVNDGPQNLNDFLDAEADPDGTFTLNGNTLEEGVFNPSMFEAGSYAVTYTPDANNVCGDGTSTLNITLSEIPNAPQGTDQTYCAVDAPTVADLGVSGSNLTYYSDEALSTMLTLDDVLTEGIYYVTQSNTETGCESEALVINVSINDAPKPTIDIDNLELCEFDNNTISDLSDAIIEEGQVTWYDSANGTNALSESTPLVDGQTYYATLFSANTGCESSQRLAVTVNLQECALVFPEGISPNGDRRNDTFIIRNIGSKYPNYKIEIFNRWGNTVYKGNANTQPWDGTSTESGTLGDDVLPVGVYFYVVDFNDGVTPPRQGTIHLSR